MQAIHSKVHHALESNEDIETLKAEVEQHWKDVRKALGKLESNIKKPVNRSEVFVTFGLSGGKDQGPLTGLFILVRVLPSF